MSLHHILQALRNGEASLEQTRQALTVNHSKPEPPVAGPLSQEQVRQQLIASLAAALYMEPGEIDLELPFTELGLDSIVGVEWVNSLNKQYGFKVPATKVYDYPDIEAFSHYLHSQIMENRLVPPVAPVPAYGSSSSASASPEITDNVMRQNVHVPGNSEAQPSAGGAIQQQTPQPQNSIFQERIAIVGMSGRYPDAADLTQYWENLVNAKNCVHEIPRERWNADAYYDSDRSQPGKIYCKWLGALTYIDCFDPSFFMISPLEAEDMDPQHRIFLEEAYKAFEAAGYSPQALNNANCGVYMGIMNSEYVHLLPPQAKGLNTGNTPSIAAARIPYFLNLKGPAIPIDTACSSSLVATHLACQALRSHEIDMALVGGVTLYLTPASFIGMCAAGMLSPDGRCKTFDIGADGFVPGEGVGTLVLKRLADAERDGDSIYGVIIGSGINQDGRTNGITAPSVLSQIELERDIYRRFDIDPATIDYVETHGTGTQLGDPIELEAITTVFREKTARRNFCGLGSVKSNIGHTSAAAGVAGMQKMLLCLQHQQLVPSLNFTQANPHCDFTDSPFYVNTELKPWPSRPGNPRRAAISSFGFSGTNAHVVIEEYPGTDSAVIQPQAKQPLLIVLSAKDPSRLMTVARDLLGYLRTRPALPADQLARIAYTLQVGRDAMEQRLAFAVDSAQTLVDRLQGFINGSGVSGEDFYVGKVKRRKGKLAMFAADPAQAQQITDGLGQADPGKLLALWVGGLIFDWRALYPAALPKRISLPTYPFARERYWVKTVAKAEAAVAATASPKQAPIVLQDPAQLAQAQQALPAAVAARPLIQLTAMPQPLQAAPAQPAALEQVEYGADIFGLRMTGQRWSRADLVEIFRRLRQIDAQQSAKLALLIVDCGHFSADGLDDPGALFQEMSIQLTAECGIPVMAVLKTGCAGAAWLLASLCDVIVCSDGEPGQYPAADWQPSWQELAYMAKRFAASHGPALLPGAHTLTGRALQAAGIALPVLPVQDVEAYALQMARDIARAPRMALVQLKRRFCHYLPPFDTKGAAAPKPTAIILPRASAHAAGLAKAAQPIALASETVTLSAHANGVLLVTLCDRHSKNTFSPALAKGIAEAFAHIQQSSAYKVAVLTGFDQYFACGGTQEALLAIQEGRAHFTDANLSALPLLCEIPVIAAMQGHAIGAGWTLGMFCDQTLFSEESIYHCPYMRYGFTPGAGSTLIFPERLGMDLGREVLFTAREYKGQELKTRGLPMPVLPRAQVVGQALQLAGQMAQATRADLVNWKSAQVQALRQVLDSVYAEELAMHQATFVGNSEVRNRIESQFNPWDGGPQPPAPSLAEPDGLEIAAQDLGAFNRILAHLRATLATELHMQADAVDNEAAFIEMGLDSINSVTWVRDLQQHYGFSIAATEVYNHPTLYEFARFMLQQGRQQGEFMGEGSPAAPQVEAARQETQPAGLKTHRIAVIGMAGQFPKARNTAEFWNNLVQGVDCIEEIQAGRWPLAAYYDPNPQAPGKSYSKWMGALEDVDKFDPLFFNISPLEAEMMDPQQRLFLESCWTCIEDAGYNPATLSGSKCGVFVGCGAGDYGMSLGVDDMDATAHMGSSVSILAARISYLLNLQGPCIAMDTACSSSLVAIASACDSLILGNSDLALAGGVSVMAGPMLHIMTSKAGMLSPDGRCYTFDQRANGFVPGEGVGLVMLKNLAQAERDGDHIYGVIKGWGVNQDGKTNGITAPNGESQASLEKEVYNRFGIDPQHIQLIEAHGTGTKLGDPIEVAALKAAFQPFTRKEHYCALGSVKSNVGHLLAASGVAGVIKTLLALQYQQIPATLHFENLNEHIDLKGSPFYVNAACQDWRVPPDQARLAAVSSFGFSGTNAHLVIEEYAETPAAKAVPGPQAPAIVVLSAKNPQRLEQSARDLHQYLGAAGRLAATDLSRLAYTLQVGRPAMGARLGLVVESMDQLQAKLRQFLDGKQPAGLFSGEVKRKGQTPAAGVAAPPAVAERMSAAEAAALTERWAAGDDIDWSQLYPGDKPRRISLPAYPFARERYWNRNPPKPHRAAASASAGPLLDVALLRPVWNQADCGRQAAEFCHARHLIFTTGLSRTVVAAIQAQLPEAVCGVLAAGQPGAAEGFAAIALQAFVRIKAELAQQAQHAQKPKLLIQWIVDSRHPQSCWSGLSGLLKTVRLENPKIHTQLIEIDSDQGLAERLRENSRNPQDSHIRYRHGTRLLPGWQAITGLGSATPPWKDRGVYLITGGTGGLGLIFAREIAGHSRHPALILTGRSALDSAQLEALTALQSQGAQVSYQQADISDAEATIRLIAGIVQRYGQLNGILHAAGVIHDNFISKKSAGEFAAVLAAKVSGTVNLDLASRGLALDFMLLFSSAAAVGGNVGQADYAAANAFMDAYAHYRSSLLAGQQRQGRTLAVNWPLWKEGGMQPGQAAIEALAADNGMMPLPTRHGIAACYQAMASEYPQVLVVAGDADKMRRDSQQQTSVTEYACNSGQQSALQDKTELQKAMRSLLKQMLGETLHLAEAQIESDEPLESYGIDSILVSKLNHRLARIFPEVSQTLLFEIRTVDELAASLLGQFPQACLRWSGLDGQVNAPAPGSEPEPLSAAHATPAPVTVSAPNLASAQQAPIAVIGMAGRFAQAETLEAFWEHLKAGDDLITKIPPQRWPLDGFFHDDPRTAVALGKSYSQWGSFLDSFAEFDPLFFNISPLEALGMDPQERLFLQASWEVLEAAGYTHERLAAVDNQVGVFVGITKTGFDRYRSDWQQQGETARPNTSFGSVANRVSYLLNLNGPSMPIDTMCSSSLTAIHEACEQLRHGNCAMAIAGGVNLYLHPSSYVDLSAQYMLSADGRCKSFGKGGNGFVPGEGVGAVLLKPLANAIADGDSIHAVIRGSGINHGGKTNGYTVPNPKAQAALIHATLLKAGVNARAISYVEAHGTGTELGDPIEVTGLTQAFRNDTQDNGFCALGSVKSNLGHLEAAAGIAGLLKVILQMKHGQLAPSLHAAELNPRIPFAQTPFAVQQQLAEWRRPALAQAGDTLIYPRLAGISSFGAGGVNAHIVVEEPPPPVTQASDGNEPALIVLSAKTADRLDAYAAKLAAHLDQAADGLRLRDIAYTLQVGREAMEERLGFIAVSMEELRGKLSALLNRPDGLRDGERGRAPRGREHLALYAEDEDMAQAIDAWHRKGKLSNLLALWIQGLPLDWDKLYGQNRPRIIALPTYPFARESYWVEVKTAPHKLATARLHRLAQQNTSTLSELRFSSVLSRQDFFIADHQVNGLAIVPGVAYLEMAQAAAKLISGHAANSPLAVVLTHIAWFQPLDVTNGEATAHIGLLDKGGGGIAYEIYTAHDRAHPLVHGQGAVALKSLPLAPPLDIARLRAEIQQQRFDGAQCYAIFKSMGFEYGPSLQSIAELWVGKGQVLARLALDPALAATLDEFFVHPCLADAALQAAMGLGLAQAGAPGEAAATFMPFALEHMEILAPCTAAMWVWIRPAASAAAGGELHKLDIDLCDSHGNICLRMKHFNFRASKPDMGQDIQPERLLAYPRWAEAAVPAPGRGPEFDRRLVLICPAEPAGLLPLAESLARQLPGVDCRRLQSAQSTAQSDFESVSLQVFALVRQLLTDKTSGRMLLQILYSPQGEGALFAGLSGLLKTAHHENPRFFGQLIAIGLDDTAAGLSLKLQDNSRSPGDTQVRYRQAERQILKWQPLAAGGGKLPWQDGGVYLISGGAGGLGLIFAEAIARQTASPALILAGRSALSPEIQQAMAALALSGARVDYHCADVSQPAAVQALLQTIRRQYGVLNGIVHAAGVIHDNFIIKKTAQEFQQTLAPKVAGTVNLDAASQDFDLDCFIMFAAGAGVLGNPGQADYATANAFMDEFARYRNGLVSQGKRRGATLSIDWPLWDAGGMQMAAGARALMREKLGLLPLPAATGLTAFAEAYAAGRDQVMVLAGNSARQLQTALFDSVANVADAGGGWPQEGLQQSQADAAGLEENMAAHLKQMLSATLKIPLSRMRIDDPMAEFGIDSVVVMNLTNQLETIFHSLSKTLFFEHHTIRELSRHLVAAHPDKARQLFAGQPSGEAALRHVAGRTAGDGGDRQPHQVESMGAVQENRDSALDIAIIGLAGRYPQAGDLDAFWENLQAGKDCITEIPADRWDWRDYYAEGGAGQGKGHNSKWGGFIDDADKFDAAFFNISPRVAPFMDPQERLILEQAWQALEDAGYRRADLQLSGGEGAVAPVGVYIGAMYGEYQLFGAEASMAGHRMGFAANLASIANRVSYALNLNGPSMMVDTMCSSSLTCLHLACQDLKQGRIDMAIAGGVNLTIHPNKYLMLSGGQFISSVGRCESFGEGGDGYIPSEGVGVAILKRLADAERDGDHIYGVIKGSAINHGGRTNGYSVPNPNAQAQVVAQALREAGLGPGAISYIEAHGTGTQLGDPIEIAGLTKVFAKQPRDTRCLLGSVKSNMGHCEAAAGIAGLTKVLLQMKHRRIAPSLHSEVLNPHIDFAAGPFEVNQQLRGWQPPLLDGKTMPRIAGISSFGAGGSNAHMIVAEYLASGDSQPENVLQSPALIVLSARNSAGLKAMLDNLYQYWLSAADNTGTHLQNLAYTLQIGREAMDERLGFIANSGEDLALKLKNCIEGWPGQAAVSYYGQASSHGAKQQAFAADTALRSVVAQWLREGDYQQLLDAWAQGADIDWHQLYRAAKPRRISVPTYPFARQRYWVERLVPDFARGNGAAATGHRAAVAAKPKGVMLMPLTPQPLAASIGRELSAQPLTDLADAEPPAALDAQTAVAATHSGQALLEELQASLAQTLYLAPDEIAFDKAFIEMGLDSIVGVEWIKDINQRYGLAIVAAKIYEHGNLRKFAGFVRHEMGAAAPLDAGQARFEAEEAGPVSLQQIAGDTGFSAPPAQDRAARATDIAVIGMAGLLPGGSTLDEFWALLASGQSAFAELPSDRDWDLQQIYQPTPQPNKTYVRKGGFLSGIDQFDPLFFQISPKEAATLDPGERLFLQQAWHAIEDAGMDPLRIANRRWGVFCGYGGDYSLRIKDITGYSPHVTLAQAPSRVSHCLNLTGPCLSVDAGCASALLAIAQACDHLVLEKCDVAIAGGALIHSTPNLLVSAAQIELLAKTETGCAFDAGASGMMPAEGVGALVLKPLAAAQAAGDRICGVIEGWGNNHNGKTNGMVAPSETAQQALFAEVYQRFGIDPRGIGLVEANAAGMPLADAVEVQALSRVFAAGGVAEHSCALGSVENNIGHAFHAAGMGHILKVLLAFRHRQIPATANVKTLDPALKLAGSPFFINTETQSWTVAAGQRRRAAVNSFGATGANVHLVLAEPPLPERQPPRRRAVSQQPVLIALSAKTADGLKQRCRDLADYLDGQLEAVDFDLRQLAANLLLRRSHFEQRCALVVSDAASLTRQLRNAATGWPLQDGRLGSVEANPQLGAALAVDYGRLDQQDLLRLADGYARGMAFDIAGAFTAAEKWPMPLPGYPFEKRRCWLVDTRQPRHHAAAAPDRIDALAVGAVLRTVSGFIADITGLAEHEIDAAQPLSEYGIDSLLGIRFLNRINAAYGNGFDHTLLMSGTLTAMADLIASHAVDTSSGCNAVPPDTAAPVWRRPPFIQAMVIDCTPAAAGQTGDGFEQQLERLIAHGVGLWKRAGAVDCEFYQNSFGRDGLLSLLGDVQALYAGLAEGTRYFPASDAQKFALYESEANRSTRFDIGQSFWLDLPLDMALLNQAFRDIVQRYSIFRTGALRVGEQWLQLVHDHLAVECQEVCWPHITAKTQFERELAQFARIRHALPFAVSQTPMLEVIAVHNGDALAAVFFRSHHFHADGFSLFLFQQELYRRYAALLNHQPYPAVALQAEYAHFALSQFAPEYADNTQYWIDRWRGRRFDRVLGDKTPAPGEPTGRSGMVEMAIDGGMISQLQHFNRRHKTTLTQLVSCVLAALIYRLTGRHLPIQMVINRRDRYEFEPLLGDFSASLPMMLELTPDFTWQAVLQCYQAAALEIQRHKRFDGVALLKRVSDSAQGNLLSGIAVDSNDRDSFGVVTDFADKLIAIDMDEREAVAPLLVCLVKTHGVMTLPVIYDKSRFSSGVMRLFADTIVKWLECLLANPAMPISQLEVAPQLVNQLQCAVHADRESGAA
jgi:acyl transferase domain-containing protein/enoyl-CoA hydratase/carnithine racemase/aryl carrier-like protein